jgi:hypothetical protein
MLRTIAATTLVLTMFTGSALAYPAAEIKAKCGHLSKGEWATCANKVIDDQTTPKPGEPYFIQSYGGVVSQSRFLQVCGGSREKCLLEWDKLTKNLPRID